MVLEFVFISIHIIVSILLVAVVVLQQSKQQGLPGSVAGGGETFYGKNRGRTLDSLLSKITAILAAVFIVTSVTLSLFINQNSHSSPSHTPLPDLDAPLPDLDLENNLQIDESLRHLEFDENGLRDDSGGNEN